MPSIFYQNLVSLVVIIVMLTAPLGFLFQNHTVSRLGLLTALSPLPIPFRDNRGFENYALKRAYTLWQAGMPIQYEEQHLQSLFNQGPHKRKIALISAATWAPRIPQSWREPVYQYHLCANEAITPNPEQLQISYVNRRSNEVEFFVWYVCQ